MVEKYKIYNWGPPLVEMQLPKNILDKLLYINDNLSIGHNPDKVEKLERKIIPQEGIKWFKNNLGKYFDLYIEENIKENTDWEFDDIWINCFKPQQYIGNHVHNKDLSFVIYLKLPLLNKKLENNELAGWTMFKYGNKISNRDVIPCITHHAIEPIKGKLVLFPANLEHSSITYYTPQERITLSGNITLKI